MEGLEKCLKGIDNEEDTISIFEIGGYSFCYDLDDTSSRIIAPIGATISLRKSKKVRYCSIERGRHEEWDNRVIQTYSRKFREQFGEGISPELEIDIRNWNARRIPYPFESDSFDEFHCHQFNDNLEMEALISRFDFDAEEGRSLSPGAFVEEVRRLLKINGGFYLTFQRGLFASGGLNIPELFESRGFETFLYWSSPCSSKIEQMKLFSDAAGYADGLYIGRLRQKE